MSDTTAEEQRAKVLADINLAAGGVRGIGELLFSHQAGTVEGMNGDDTACLYMATYSLGRCIELHIQELEELDVQEQRKASKCAVGQSQR